MSLKTQKRKEIDVFSDKPIAVIFGHEELNALADGD